MAGDKAFYLASFMSDVVKPYIEHTNEVTPGMSTSSDVYIIVCQSIKFQCLGFPANTYLLHLGVEDQQSQPLVYYAVHDHMLH